MMLTRYVGECDVVPRGWGLAYLPYGQLGCYVAPIPLNLVIGALRAIYGWLLSAPMAWKSPRGRLMRRAFARGHVAGRKLGRSEGFEEWTKFNSREVARANARADTALEIITRMTKILSGQP